MAKLVLHVLNVFPLGNEQAGLGMAKIREPYERAARSLQGGPKVAPEHIVVVDVITGPVGEYQIQIIFRASQPPFL